MTNLINKTNIGDWWTSLFTPRIHTRFMELAFLILWLAASYWKEALAATVSFVLILTFLPTQVSRKISQARLKLFLSTSTMTALAIYLLQPHLTQPVMIHQNWFNYIHGLTQTTLTTISLGREDLQQILTSAHTTSWWALTRKAMDDVKDWDLAMGVGILVLSLQTALMAYILTWTSPLVRATISLFTLVGGGLKQSTSLEWLNVRTSTQLRFYQCRYIMENIFCGDIAGWRSYIGMRFILGVLGIFCFVVSFIYSLQHFLLTYAGSHNGKAVTGEDQSVSEVSDLYTGESDPFLDVNPQLVDLPSGKPNGY